MNKSTARVEGWFGPADIAVSSSKPQLLSESDLRSAITSKGTVAVMRVEDVQTRAEGLGNERVWIAATIERPIFGRSALRLELTRSGRYPGVSRGQRYVVAASGTGDILAYAPVSGELERSVEGHRRLIERIVTR